MPEKLHVFCSTSEKSICGSIVKKTPGNTVTIGVFAVQYVDGGAITYKLMAVTREEAEILFDRFLDAPKIFLIELKDLDTITMTCGEKPFHIRITFNLVGSPHKILISQNAAKRFIGKLFESNLAEKLHEQVKMARENQIDLFEKNVSSLVEELISE